MDNSVSCGEEARGRESDPLIKMNGILEPGKRMVGLCKDLNHVASCFCFVFPLQQEEALLLFFWKHHQNPLETCVVNACVQKGNSSQNV